MFYCADCVSCYWLGVVVCWEVFDIKLLLLLTMNLTIYCSFRQISIFGVTFYACEHLYIKYYLCIKTNLIVKILIYSA